jgi:hypothetical protein
MGGKGGVAMPSAEQGSLGMLERHFHTENNWRKELSLLTGSVIGERKSLLMLGTVARWCCLQGGKPWRVYGKKALEQLEAWGGAVTRGSGMATHGNISAGNKNACFCYCDRTYKRVVCPENAVSSTNCFSNADIVCKYKCNDEPFEKV